MIPAAIFNPNGLNISPPRRGLALTVSLVTLAAGYFVPLHLLAALNLLFGHPLVTARVVIWTSLAGIGVSAYLLSRTGMIEQAQASRDANGDDISVWAKVAVAVPLFAIAALLLNSFWSFPDGYDALSYHINVALKWLQQGTMRLNPGWGWEFALPGNGEMQALGFLSAGMQKGVATGNLLAAMLLASSLYLIAWRLTRRTEPALLAAVVGITIPMVTYQAFQLFVDLFGTAFLMAAVALLIWRQANPRVCNFLSGYAAGLAMGTKPVFWVYAALFAVAVLATVLREPKSPTRPAVSLLAAGMVLACGFWFVRSAAATGNPVYPMRVSVGGVEIFHGYSRAEITPSGKFELEPLINAIGQPWSEKTNENVRPVSAGHGTGLLFAAIALPGLLFIVVQVIGRRASVLEMSLLVAIVAGFVLWNATLLRVPRFALPLITLSSALSAPMILAVTGFKRHMPAILCLFGVLLNSFYCLAEPASLVVTRLRLHDWSRATYYGYPRVLDSLPVGSCVLDLTETHRFSFALAGVGLTNYVLPEGGLESADYVVREGPDEKADTGLRSTGAELIYEGTPRSLYPKVARPWRVYRMRR